MKRIADSTIKGFLYQFNLTLLSVLETELEEVRVEGLIEDIDIIREGTITAIQCKYHESKSDFSLSAIYKPVLQMMKHYCEMKEQNEEINLQYILYAYFPSLEQGIQEITVDDLEEMLTTTNIEYICSYIAYLKKCEDPQIQGLINKSSKKAGDKEQIKDYFMNNTLDLRLDLEGFIECFKFNAGVSFKEMEAQVCGKLEDIEEFTAQDINEIIYPNAIQRIAEISMEKDEKNRILNRQWLVKYLTGIKRMSITRWTRELTSYHDLLKVKGKQIRNNLNTNFRKRYFIIDADELVDFEEKIVMLIKDYTYLYCSKPKLHIPAIFCVVGYDKSKLDNLESRLYTKGVAAETGYKGNDFFKEAFVRDPEIKQREKWMEFVVKICFGNKEIYEILSEDKPDDLFVIADDIPKEIDCQDVNVEYVDVKNIDDLKYLLKIESEVRV